MDTDHHDVSTWVGANTNLDKVSEAREDEATDSDQEHQEPQLLDTVLQGVRNSLWVISGNQLELTVTLTHNDL